MFGFNWIDGSIVILLIGAIALSVKIGLLRQVLVVSGFFGALFLGGWIFPHLLTIHDRTMLTLVNANLVLITATYVAVRSFDLADRMRWSLRENSGWRRAESWLGAFSGLVFSLLLVGLLAVMLGRLPFAGLSNSTNESRIVQLLVNVLPPVPAVFATFNHQVNPNSSPHLFSQPKPRADFNYSVAASAAAATYAKTAVVRLTGFGCGGLVSGSGFAVGPDLVATNAHVIAGVKRPIIKYDIHSYEGVPILFNPNLDFAVLRVKHLDAKPLILADKPIRLQSTVAAAGYPGGNFEAAPGIVRNQLQVFGRNIYDIGVVGRNVYEVQTSIGTGGSGGPLILADGRAAGMIFAHSNDLDDYAYALASPNLLPGLKHVEKSTHRVSTGACLAD